MQQLFPTALKSGYANKDAVIAARAEISNAEMKALVAARARIVREELP